MYCGMQDRLHRVRRRQRQEEDLKALLRPGTDPKAAHFLVLFGRRSAMHFRKSTEVQPECNPCYDCKRRVLWTCLAFQPLAPSSKLVQV